MMRNLFAAAVALVAISLTMPPAQSQDTLLGELYGQGVHNYFNGDYSAAYDQFTRAIDQGSRDPRCYYFRAIVLEKTGRPDEAKKDFEKGAQLEAGGEIQSSVIARSFERVQGTLRLTLENYRTDARLAQKEQAEAIRRAKYEARKALEPKRIRGGAEPPDDLPGLPAPTTTDPTAPFGGDAPTEINPTVEPAPTDLPTIDEPKPATPATGDDPFGGTPKPVTPATGDDPFGGTPKPAAGGDPFGAPTPAPAKGDDDPLGGAPAPAVDPKPADDNPFAGDDGGGAPAKQGSVFGSLIKAFGKSITGDSDPAGDDGAAPVAPAPGGDPFAPPPGGAAPAADPFGEKPGAAPAPNDDPFGGK